MNHDTYISPPAKLGIIGGGQLGKMMAQSAKQMGFTVVVLDPTPNSPAGQVADTQIVGSFSDAAKIRQLVETSDITTYDLENINTDALAQLTADGYRLHPSPQTLGIIQDKLQQKRVLSQSGIPMPAFVGVDELSIDVFEQFGFPLVQKVRRGGYDGRGVVVLHSKDDFHQAVPADSYIEKLVDIKTELAVMVARNEQGETKAYPVVEMVFDDATNILDLLLAPARIPSAMAEEAQRLAIRTVEVLKGVGVFGVEMFVSKADELFVNEVAPRPHNSGHYTIEACVTSQFEQHLRAIMGLPLGSTDLLSPAAMVNLVGDDTVSYRSMFYEVMSVPGASFHLYGKQPAKHQRKMGHITVIDNDIEEAYRKAVEIKKVLDFAGR